MNRDDGVVYMLSFCLLLALVLLLKSTPPPRVAQIRKDNPYETQQQRNIKNSK